VGSRAAAARRRVRAARPAAAPAARQAGVVRDFRRAWEASDIHALVALLDPDATVVTDGGGLVSAMLQPVEGGEEIARRCVDFADRAPGLTVTERTVNGQPGLIAWRDGTITAVLAFAIAGDRIMRVWIVLNPEKLRPWTTG
jgi:RNA polymerase sigma-70 factor (ECF subfamily)